MEAANFAVDFTQLLMRYTTPKTPNEKEKQTNGPSAPLTPAVIVELVQESLKTILSTNITEDVYKTPSNNFVINTPDAPNITRASLNEIQNDIQNGIISEQYVNTLSEKMQAATEKKDPSPPKMHLSAMRRSGTFVHEDDNPISKDIEKSLGNSEIQVKINDDVFETSKKTSDGTLQMKLDALRKCAADVIAKIDEVKRPSTVVASKPIRRLSTVGVYTCTERNSSMMRSIQPPNVRRSFTAVGTTPTSSRLNNTILLGEPLNKRKSSSTASLQITSSTIPSKTTLTTSAARSNTSISLPTSKKSPSSDSKPPKNPKYAHIQSSIPKPSFVPKRKV